MSKKRHEVRIKNWKQFARHGRPKGCCLLTRLDEFPNSVLVAGCQRSGTTMLARAITQNAGMTDYWVGKDDELDAALILAGLTDHRPHGRYCFQTTYLNECYREYFEHKGNFKLVWLIRNPYSVVYSLTYNWKRFALNELFQACGAQKLDSKYSKKYSRFGKLAVSPFMRACFSYVGKAEQIFPIREALGVEDVLVVEYDNLARNKEAELRRVFEFIDSPYDASFTDMIHARSLGKANQLSIRKTAIIEKYCQPVYERTRALA